MIIKRNFEAIFCISVLLSFFSCKTDTISTDVTKNYFFTDDFESGD